MTDRSLDELERVAEELRFGICTKVAFGLASLGDVDTATTERRMQAGADAILALLARLKAAEAALINLVAHIDRHEYRDKAGLRLGPTVPHYEDARAVLKASPHA